MVDVASNRELNCLCEKVKYKLDLKRVQLFEVEDFNWFPKSIRNSMTNLIMVLMKMLGTNEVLGNLIVEAKTTFDFEQIVDLG